MRDHEIELISALAEGSLEDESEARALIESSEEARAEYESQVAAIEALESAPPVEMTEYERSALRRDVWTAVRSDPSPGRNSVPWYFRWAYAAAALFVVVGVGAVLTQNLGGDDADTADAVAEMTAEDAPATSEAASRLSGDPDDAVGAAAAEEGGDDAGESDGEATDTTSSADSAPPTSPEFFALSAERVRSGELDKSSVSADSEAESQDLDACLEQAGLEGHELIAQVQDVEGTEPTLYLIAAPEGRSMEPDTQLAFVIADTCELAHTEG